MNMIKKNYKLISILILAASLIPYILISFYSRPCADDYNYSIEMIRMVERGENGLFPVIKAALQTDLDFYRSWNGLYAGAFLQALQPGSYLGERNYYAGVLALMLVIFLCLYYFIRTLFTVFETGLKPLLPTCILFAIFVHGMISPAQGLYWLGGAYNYLPFLFLLLVNVALILNYNYHNDTETKYLLLSSLVSFIVGGGNHITSFLDILVLLVFSVSSLIRKKKRGVTIPLLIAIGGFLLVVLAPGTRVRASVNVSQSLPATLIATVMKALELVRSADYTMNLRFVVYLLLLLLLASSVKDNASIKAIRIHPILLFLIFAMFFCEMLAVPYYSMGSFGAGRVKNIDWMAFTVMIGLLWVYLLIRLADRSPFIDRFLERINRADKALPVILSCVLLVAFSRNMYAVGKELSDGTAQTFASQCDERYETMKRYRGSEEIIEVDPLIDSSILKFNDIVNDLQDWRNHSWYEYYRVKTIVRSEQ